MAKSATVDITILTDSSKAEKGFDDAARAADKLGSAVDQASRKVDTGADRMANAADAADNLDSKSAQATGALGALSSGFELVGADKYAAGLQSAALATDFMAGVGEGLNLILELQSVQWLKNKAAVIANTIAEKAAAAAAKATAAAQWLLNAAMSANPIGLVVIAVIALVAGLELLYKKSAAARKIMNAIWAGIKAGAAAAGRVLVAVLGGAFKVLQTIASVYWRLIKSVFGLYRTIVLTVARVIRSALSTAWQAAQAVFSRVWAAIKTALSWNPTTVLKRVWSGVEDVLTAPFKAAEKVIRAIASGLGGIFRSGLSGIMSLINDLINALNKVISAFNKIPGHSDISPIPPVGAAAAAAQAPAVASASVAGRYTAPTVASRATAGQIVGLGGAVVINLNGVIGDRYGIAKEIAQLLTGMALVNGQAATR